MLPLGVSEEPTRHLSTDRTQALMEAIRTSAPSLIGQMKALEAILGSDAEKVGLQNKASTSSSRLDRYDWFYLVERVDDDSDLVGLVALLQTMSDYARLLTSNSILTELEEATLAEAVQSIVENYGERR